MMQWSAESRYYHNITHVLNGKAVRVHKIDTIYLQLQNIQSKYTYCFEVYIHIVKFKRCLQRRQKYQINGSVYLQQRVRTMALERKDTEDI